MKILFQGLRKKSMLALNFFAMNSQRFVWKNDRLCIPDLGKCSRIHPRTFRKYCFFLEPSQRHRRCTSEVSAILRGCIAEYSPTYLGHLHRQSIRDVSGMYPRIFANISGTSGFCHCSTHLCRYTYRGILSSSTSPMSFP